MTNPKYLVNIYYQGEVRTGSIGASVSGTWITTPTFSGGWYVATMPEVGLYATGSSYVNALNALITVATSSNIYDAAQGPLNK